MAGASSGGKNPTAIEYLSAHVRNQYQQRFMAELMRSDPRAQNMTTMLLNQMSESSQKATLNLFGGRANLQEMVGMALSMPGVAPFVGGSPLSIGQGAYAAASSGMRVGGYRMYDGAGAMIGANAIVNQITRQFYFQGGGANLAATSGLSRDQIGGIMMLGAAQGAFSGMNLGDIVAKGGRLNLNMDQGTITKISQFTKTAAKALSSLIDVYGDGSVAELAAKANQITGLNFDRIGNAGLISNRLAALRQTGTAFGIDTGTMFDVAAMSTQMGRRMGLSDSFSGNVGTAAAQNAAMVFRANQSQAGSFRTATYSIQEIAGGMVRDQAGMMMDPIGRRRAALQLGMETGHFTGSAAEEARRLIREDGAGAIGRIDRFMQTQGISTDSYIKLMGGPQGMQRMLSESGLDNLRDINAETVGQRARATLRRQAVRTFGRGIIGEGGKALMGAIEGIDKETLDRIFQATRSGFNESTVSQLLQGDPAGKVNTEGYLKMVRTAVNELGGERAAAWHASLQQAISANPFLASSFITESGRMVAANQRMGVLQFGADNRGAMMGGKFIEGLLNHMSGDDPRSSFARAMQMYPTNIIGSNQDVYMPVEGGKIDDTVRGKMRKTAGALLAGMSGTEVGRKALGVLGIEGKNAAAMTVEELNAFTIKLANPITRATAFQDYQLAQFGESFMLMSRDRVLRAQQWGGTAAAADKLSTLFSPSDSRREYMSRLGEMFRDPTRDNVDRMMDTMSRHTRDIPMLAKWADSGDLAQLAKMSPLWAQGMSEWVVKEGASAQEKKDTSALANVKKIMDVLGGGREGALPNMVLSGQLELVGNALQLVGGGLKQSEVKK